MPLPLKARVSVEDAAFCVTTEARTAGPSVRSLDTALIPQSALRPGEQYRFHFDMTKCIGCHCCEVACSEQNNNPAGVHWRRVGEIEGGEYPFTKRLHLSIGCNHCLEPSCLTGCPVDAYTKDSITGIVHHSADTCIGCQYCTWNCQYGVPQYNPERGVVGKCDMCYGRLSDGREPACVAACPEGAIRIEVVNIAGWRREVGLEGNAPGMPSADKTVSTTRLTVPKSLPFELKKADYDRVGPEHPHAPLVAMTVLTQLAVGAFAAIWVASLARTGKALPSGAAVAFAIACLAVGASTLHLGRPVHAYRALKMWRRSWLSREVLAFSLFAAAAFFYSAALWLKLPAAPVLGAVTLLSGTAGITASAFIYLVPARPSWNSKRTIAEFFLTAGVLGCLFGTVLTGAGTAFVTAAVVSSGLQLLNQALKFLWLTRSDEFELRASARLLSQDLQTAFLLRFAILIAGGIVLPLAGWFLAGLLLATVGELLGRYLFFVSVVPRNIAASFFDRRAA